MSCHVRFLCPCPCFLAFTLPRQSNRKSFMHEASIPKIEQPLICLTLLSQYNIAAQVMAEIVTKKRPFPLIIGTVSIPLSDNILTIKQVHDLFLYILLFHFNKISKSIARIFTLKFQIIQNCKYETIVCETKKHKYNCWYKLNATRSSQISHWQDTK